MRTAAWLPWLVLLAAPAIRQELSVRGPEPAVVKPGGQALVILSLEAVRGDAQLLPPREVPGLDVRIGPPLVDGRMSDERRISWEISLQPNREGRFELPPLEVRASGQTYTSRAMQLECVSAISGEQYAFVELSAPRKAYFVQERIRLKLRFGLDREFLRSNLVQMFTRELDIPVQLQAPWITELSGAVPLAEDARSYSKSPDDERFRFALNDEIAEAVRVDDRDRGGRTFVVLEFEKTYVAVRSGELEVSAPLLRFACATRFEEDVFSATAAADWQLAFVGGAPLILRIEPLPEEGRPAGFTGAVGRFTVSAEATPRELEVGDSLKLALRIEGEGNLDSFDTPSLDALEGFHVQGKIEEKSRERRTVTYDLAPLAADVTEVPAIAFSFFDPADPPGYRTVWTQPIPLRVRSPSEDARIARSAEGGAEEGFPGQPHGEQTTAPAPETRIGDEGLSATELIVGAVIALSGLAVVVWISRRARRSSARAAP